MFRKTIFGHFLDINLVFNGPLCNYILLKEVKDEWNDLISFKLLGQKVSLRWENFDISTGLRFRSRLIVKFKQKKAVRLRRLYLDDKKNTNKSELDKEYLTLNFESDEDAMKMSLFYFIELVMMERKRRQHMD